MSGLAQTFLLHKWNFLKRSTMISQKFGGFRKNLGIFYLFVLPDLEFHVSGIICSMKPYVFEFSCPGLCQ